MGHESPIEPWLPGTTVLLVSSRADWLRRKEAMKTAERENRDRWAVVFSIRVDGPAGENTPNLITRGWKQEKLRQRGKCFFLTSPSIEQLEKSFAAALSTGNQTQPGVRIEDCPIGTSPRLRDHTRMQQRAPLPTLTDPRCPQGRGPGTPAL